MKGRVDKSMGIVILIAEALVKINPTEPLRFAKRAARRAAIIFIPVAVNPIIFIPVAVNTSGPSVLFIPVALNTAVPAVFRTRSVHTATRSVHGDRYKYDWVRLICVELTIMPNHYSGRTV